MECGRGLETVINLSKKWLIMPQFIGFPPTIAVVVSNCLSSVTDHKPPCVTLPLYRISLVLFHYVNLILVNLLLIRLILHTSLYLSHLFLPSITDHSFTLIIIIIITRKPCCRKETARCRKCSFRLKFKVKVTCLELVEKQWGNK